jgi:hypothetical protein
MRELHSLRDVGILVSRDVGRQVVYRPSRTARSMTNYGPSFARRHRGQILGRHIGESQSLDLSTQTVASLLPDRQLKRDVAAERG